jgi:peptidoglycan-associated lipoprotein
MVNRRWFYVVLGVMVCSLAVSGCKKKPKSGSGLDGDSGVIGTPIDGEGAMGDRIPGDEQRDLFSVVFFDYDSALVNPSENSKLDTVVDHLKQNSAQSLTVEGHCDERGSNEYNLSLGERRALAVRAYLVGHGIEADKVQTKSYGEERPVAMGHDEASWSQNRRAEFVIVQ